MPIPRIIILILFAFAATVPTVAFTGCGASEPAPTPVPGRGGTPPGADDDARQAAQQFAGQWELGCTPASDTISVMSSLTITGDRFDEVTRLFSGARCGILLSTDETSGTIDVVARSAADPSAWQVDWHDETGGTSDQAGTRFDLIKRDGDRLWRAASAGASAAERPTVLDTSHYYIRANSPAPGATSGPDPRPSTSDTPVPTPPTPGPAPAPVPEIPTRCTDFSGDFIMNTDSLTLQQSGCAQLDWTYNPNYFNPQAWTYLYYTNAIETEEPAATSPAGVRVFKTSRFVASGTKIEIRVREVRGLQIKRYRQVISFEKRPCDLLNPNGGLYLTRQTYRDEATLPDASQCMFWSRL